MILLKCIIGPRLYRLHKRLSDGGTRSRVPTAYDHLNEDNQNPARIQGCDYEPGSLENGANSVIRWLRFLKALCQWSSPMLFFYMYRRDYFTSAGSFWLMKSIGGLLIVYSIAVFFRGVSRAMNPVYVEFINDLYKARKNYTKGNKQTLHMYDSDIFPWPVDYKWDQNKASGEQKHYTPKDYKAPKSLVGKITSLPSSILGYCAIHTFGRRMVFPGTTCIQALFAPRLNIGRALLVEDKNGDRAKLKTKDGNYIDTMFVDRRNQEVYPNGNTLVVCSEGNAGFYEIGCMVTPLEAGYSVIGWNHPGFCNSTGIPFPSQEQCAIDVVMQYVLEELKFDPGQIMLFSWSIGGYASTWAAMAYPDVKCVILDATFDDLIPLAIPRMPSFLNSLVTTTLRKYMDLDNASQLCKYPGPVLIIRRSRDEMITTQDGVLATNRGNHLLVKLLQARYPNIVDDSTQELFDEWLSVERTEQSSLYDDYEVEEDLCEQLLATYIAHHNQNSYPILIGDDMDQDEKDKFLLFLASKYMDEFAAPHGMPLPSMFIRHPWSEFTSQKPYPDTTDDTKDSQPKL